VPQLPDENTLMLLDQDVVILLKPLPTAGTEPGGRFAPALVESRTGEAQMLSQYITNKSLLPVADNVNSVRPHDCFNTL